MFLAGALQNGAQASESEVGEKRLDCELRRFY
jgi:hypothetical protein